MVKAICSFTSKALIVVSVVFCGYAAEVATGFSSGSALANPLLKKVGEAFKHKRLSATAVTRAELGSMKEGALNQFFPLPSSYSTTHKIGQGALGFRVPMKDPTSGKLLRAFVDSSGTPKLDTFQALLGEIDNYRLMRQVDGPQLHGVGMMTENAGDLVAGHTGLIVELVPGHPLFDAVHSRSLTAEMVEQYDALVARVIAMDRLPGDFHLKNVLHSSSGLRPVDSALLPMTRVDPGLQALYINNTIDARRVLSRALERSGAKGAILMDPAYISVMERYLH